MNNTLKARPERGKLIKKFIFGEGSSIDIKDWPDKKLVPQLITSADNVEVIGFDGLQNVDLDSFQEALQSRPKLHELRGCGERCISAGHHIGATTDTTVTGTRSDAGACVPCFPQQPISYFPYAYFFLLKAWCQVGHFFDNVLRPCHKIKAFRLYSLSSETEPAKSGKTTATSPRPLDQAFERVAFNGCSIDHLELRNILHGSTKSLQSIYLEYPMSLPDRDLVKVLRFVGDGLRSLTVHYFAAGLSQEDLDLQGHLVEEILEACPHLEVLNFPDAVGSLKLFEKVVRSKLKLWAFSCGPEVKPQHWLDAFKTPGFPSPSSCRVYTTGRIRRLLRACDMSGGPLRIVPSVPPLLGWTVREIRHVRVEAHKIGLNWLASGGKCGITAISSIIWTDMFDTLEATLTDLSEESIS